MDFCSIITSSTHHILDISPTLPSPGKQDSESPRHFAGGGKEFCKSEGLKAPHFCEIFPPSPFRRSGESPAHEVNFPSCLAAGRAAGRGGAKSSKMKCSGVKAVSLL